MPSLQNIGSLITTGDNVALGYLICHEGAVYDPSHGRVDIRPEQAHIHNKHLDKAMLHGLDERCEIGQGSTFYLKQVDSKPIVTTWLGTLVSDQVKVTASVCEFHRNGKSFRGNIRKSGDNIMFKRYV